MLSRVPTSRCATHATVSDDPDDFGAWIGRGGAQITVTGSGRFQASARLVQLKRLRLQRVHETVPRILEGQQTPGRHAIIFHLQDGPSMFAEGRTVGHGDIALYSGGSDCLHRLSGPTTWASLSLPEHDWTQLGGKMAGSARMARFEGPPITPPASAVENLRRLHAAAVRVAAETPDVLRNANAVEGLEADLAHAAMACIDRPNGPASTLAQRHHATIMRRFRRMLTEHAAAPLYLAEVCAALGVADRTLRLCCNEHLGIGPKRYLCLRRMHLARRALRQSAAGAASVTEIATRFGFWELGRFAGEYKGLFGEAPSATLRRPA